MTSASTKHSLRLRNPALAVTTTATRNWTDSNRNFVPDCDLLNPAAQNLTAVGGDNCAAISDPNFGNPKPSSTYDPDLMRGWNRRNYNWEFSAGVQRQLLTGVSMDVSYFRRWFGNFTVSDNKTLDASDFDKFDITAPSNLALPSGGGYAVSGLYDLKPAKFGLPANNVFTRADNYGKQYQHWNGVDVVFNVRPGGGILLQGGTSTGRTMYDNCEVAAKVPESLQGAPVFFIANTTGVWQPSSFCHVQTPFQTQGKLLGSYTVPKVGVQVSATYQSIPGPVIQANYVATNTVVSPGLGRNLSGGAANLTVNIVKPGTLYGERLNQLDMRFAKIFNFGARRTTVSLDLFNAPNLNTVITENSNYAAFRQPTSILLARFAKINVQFDF